MSSEAPEPVADPGSQSSGLRVVLAGGHGQIALLAQRRLAAEGHRPVGLIRRPEHADDLRAVGAEPLVFDLEHQTAAELAEALRQNLEMYAAKFGPPPTVPPPAVPPRQLTLAEVYENFRIADDMLAGAYANSVLVGHSPTEFFMDFIAGFYPTSAVSARVFMSAPQIPKFLASLSAILDQHARRFGGGGSPPPPPSIAG